MRELHKINARTVNANLTSVKDSLAVQTGIVLSASDAATVNLAELPVGGVAVAVLLVDVEGHDLDTEASIGATRL